MRLRLSQIVDSCEPLKPFLLKYMDVVLENLTFKLDVWVVTFYLLSSLEGHSKVTHSQAEMDRIHYKVFANSQFLTCVFCILVAETPQISSYL